MSTKRYTSYDKKFLDVSSSRASEEFASICWNVDVQENDYDTKCPTKKPYIDASLRVSDCFKTVTLDFNADLDEVEIRIKKLRVLRDSINEMLTQFDLAGGVMQEVSKEPNPRFKGEAATSDED